MTHSAMGGKDVVREAADRNTLSLHPVQNSEVTPLRSWFSEREDLLPDDQSLVRENWQRVATQTLLLADKRWWPAFLQ